MERVNTNKLSKEISAHTDIPLKDVKEVLKFLWSEIEYQLFQGKKVELTWILTLSLKDVAWKVMYHPTKKKKIPINKKRSIRSTISIHFQNRLNLFDEHN